MTNMEHKNREMADFERRMRVLSHDGGIYPPDKNLYLVENKGPNRAERRASKGKVLKQNW